MPFAGSLARLGWLGIAAFVLGCGPSAELSEVRSNQFELRGIVANDRQQIDSLREQVSRLNDRLSEIEHNGVDGSGGTGAAALQQRLSKLEAQMATMQPANPAAADSAGAGVPGAGLGETPPAEPGAAPANGGPAGVSPSSATAPEAEPAPWRGALDRELAAAHNEPGAKLYRAALLDAQAGRYPQAITKFQDFQRRYPKSGLSEAAEYFSANALFESGKYDQSILQFNDLTMRFPRGRFVTAAMLREAQAFVKINDRIDARLTLQKLLGDHPDSPEAPSAKAMMQTLAS